MREVKTFYLLLHPRPAYIIGSGRFGERVNVMAASWVVPAAEEPPLVVISIGVDSLTHKLIETFGEFTVNIVSMEMLGQLYYVGRISGHKEDKTKLVKVVKGEKVSAPVVDGAVGIIECKVYSTAKAEDVTIFIGEVLTARADERFFDDRKGWDFKEIDLPLHNWGRGFYGVGAFRMAKS
ncbi:MAG: flavin reductase family protein [Thermofilaceae archaeon]